MYTTVGQNKHCEIVKRLLLVDILKHLRGFSTGYLHFCMNLLICPVMVGIIELRNSLLAVSICAKIRR